MDESISRKAAIDTIVDCTNCRTEEALREYVAKHNLDNMWTGGILEALDAVKDLPSVKLENCEGCKHLGKWENEVEYGYPSPCTRCKRRAEDHYER